MTFDAVRRRYGYGAARLAIGGGANAPSLAQLARSPVDRELPFASLPGLICIILSALLLSTIDDRLQSVRRRIIEVHIMWARRR